MRTIVIVIDDSQSHFDVHEGTSFVDQLTWDEMLGTLAVITHPTLNKLQPRVPPYRMRSFEEQRKTVSELRRRVRDLEEKQLPTMEPLI